MPEQQEVTALGSRLSDEAKDVLERVDRLIKAVVDTPELYEDIKNRLCAQNIAFKSVKFQTLVRDVSKDNHDEDVERVVEKLKKSRQRLMRGGNSKTDIKNLNDFCVAAEAKYADWVGWVSVPEIWQNDDAVKKEYGEAFFDEIRKFSREYDESRRGKSDKKAAP